MLEIAELSRKTADVWFSDSSPVGDIGFIEVVGFCEIIEFIAFIETVGGIGDGEFKEFLEACEAGSPM